MNLSKPNASLSWQIAMREKIEAKGRSHFIFYTGMLRWGLSVFVIQTLWKWHSKYAWHTPPRADMFSNFIEMTFSLALWLTAGYFFGSRLWKKVVGTDSTAERSMCERPDSLMKALIAAWKRSR
jgi:hypothetical protein